MNNEIQKSDALEFTLEQRKMIRDSFLSGASEPEAAMLLEVARIRKLNPITKQIYFVKRWDSNKRCEVWATQVSIDGFRTIAERTGRYDGQDEPEFEHGPDGMPKVCRVKAYRKDWGRPAVGVAYFTEYAQYTKDKHLTSMWATKPHVMLAKCAEALALRKAFPEDMSGLYSPEEMGASEERDVTPPVQAAPVEKDITPTTGTVTARVKELVSSMRMPAANGDERAQPKQVPAQNGAWAVVKKIKEAVDGAGFSQADGSEFVRSIIGTKVAKDITEADYEAVLAALQPPQVEQDVAAAG